MMIKRSAISLSNINKVVIVQDQQKQIFDNIEIDTVKKRISQINLAHIPQLRAEKKIVHLYYFFLRRLIIDFNNFIKKPV